MFYMSYMLCMSSIGKYVQNILLDFIMSHILYLSSGRMVNMDIVFMYHRASQTQNRPSQQKPEAQKADSK